MRQSICALLLHAFGGLCNFTTRDSLHDRLSKSEAYSNGDLGVCPNETFVSEDIRVPLINVVRWSEDCADGLDYFFAPRCKNDQTISGPVIYDARGQLVWKGTSFNNVHHTKIQRYKGQDYLFFWAGNTTNRVGHGTGRFYMLDESYTVIRNISAAGGEDCDFHEFRITPRGTVLITIFTPTKFDLSPIGGPKEGYIWENTFQEVNIADNSLVFEWRASKHLNPLESHRPWEPDLGTLSRPYDAFHMNSVDIDIDGNYVVSIRHLDAVVYISHQKGDIIWALGGVHNDFAVGSGWNGAIDFRWQHDAHWDTSMPNTLLLFNNFEAQYPPFHHGGSSHGLQIRLNFDLMTADLVSNYSEAVEPYLGIAEGSIQRIAQGCVLVSYGSAPAFAKFTPSGELQCEMQYGSRIGFKTRQQTNYRVYKYAWTGRPTTLPRAVVDSGVVYVSWNGATEVRNWRIEQCDSLNPDCIWSSIDAPKDGFETAIALWDTTRVLVMSAIDENGKTLAKTKMIEVDRGSPSKSSDAGPRGNRWHKHLLGKIGYYSRHLFVVLLTVIIALCILIAAKTFRGGSLRGRVHRYEPLRT